MPWALWTTVLTIGVLTIVPSAQTACSETYAVVSGDSCPAIAQKNAISSFQLGRLNPSMICSALSVGQTLCVTDPAYDCQPVHTVVSGDTCFDIASSEGTTVDVLIANNPEIGSNCILQVGEVLCTAPTDITTPTCTSTYTVRSGDSCDLIASSNNVSSYQLLLLNPSLLCAALLVGQTLCLRGPSYSCQPVYTVASGDTCFGIASSHSITTDQLLVNNPQLGPTCALTIGLSLCISATTPATTTTATTITTTTTTSPTPTSTPCTRFTTIQNGETCNDIGARTGTPLYWILTLNPSINSDCSNIQAGEAICVDSLSVDCSSVYQVKGIEGGCSGIASILSIPLQMLLDLNPNVNSQCTNLQVNEVLCTAHRSSTPPSTVCTRTYTVVLGDTCQTIASRNSLTTAQLTALNPDMTCSSLIPGDSLCSFSPSLSICPKLVVVAGGDTCFTLAQNASMALQEWQSINTGLNCDPLQTGAIVCSSQGNTTLPQVPSGSNPTSLPLCGRYDKTEYCCTSFSVSASLFDSPLCERKNGCQDNCIGDPGVTVPAQSPTPTFTLTPTLFPTPTPLPSECDNCTSNQCCALNGLCVNDLSSWYCQSVNGCTRNCDQGVPMGSYDIPDQQTFDIPNITFPSGDYLASGGNPCGVCNADTADIASPSGQYCCTSSIQCVPQEFTQCTIFAGCLFNCVDFILDSEEDCDMLGKCDVTKTTIMQPFATSTST